MGAIVSRTETTKLSKDNNEITELEVYQKALDALKKGKKVPFFGEDYDLDKLNAHNLRDLIRQLQGTKNKKTSVSKPKKNVNKHKFAW